jgi:hypothetical protein
MESTSIVVMVPYFTPFILIVLDLVMDDVLVGEGQQKEVNKIGENMGIATN